MSNKKKTKEITEIDLSSNDNLNFLFLFSIRIRRFNQIVSLKTIEVVFTVVMSYERVRRLFVDSFFRILNLNVLCNALVILLERSKVTQKLFIMIAQL